tara:strand:- start:48 stop:254 length:207 start_codon:yes stop_codon:yes gene_type:complete
MSDIVRVCIKKSNNEILEMQAHDAELGTLKNNLVNNGFNAEELEEKKVNQEQLNELLALEVNSSLRRL